MTPESVTEMQSLSANVPKDLYERFNDLAKSHERSLSAELRRAMRSHLDAESRRTDGEANGGAA